MKTVLTILVISSMTAVAASNTKHLTYDELIRQVEAGNVKSISVGKLGPIKGVLLGGEQEKEFSSYGKTGTANDPLLQRFLEKHNVEVNFDNNREDDSRTVPMMLTGCFTIILPLILIILPFILIFLLISIRRKVNQLLKLQNTNPDYYKQVPSDYDMR